jgi:hypothetical protein
VNNAPRVVLRATHEGALTYCRLADLKRLSVELPRSDKVHGSQCSSRHAGPVMRRT